MAEKAEVVRYESGLGIGLGIKYTVGRQVTDVKPEGVNDSIRAFLGAHKYRSQGGVPYADEVPTSRKKRGEGAANMKPGEFRKIVIESQQLDDDYFDGKTFNRMLDGKEDWSEVYLQPVVAYFAAHSSLADLATRTTTILTRDKPEAVSQSQITDGDSSDDEPIIPDDEDDAIAKENGDLDEIAGGNGNTSDGEGSNGNDYGKRIERVSQDLDALAGRYRKLIEYVNEIDTFDPDEFDEKLQELKEYHASVVVKEFEKVPDLLTAHYKNVVVPEMKKLREALEGKVDKSEMEKFSTELREVLEGKVNKTELEVLLGSELGALQLKDGKQQQEIDSLKEKVKQGQGLAPYDWTKTDEHLASTERSLEEIDKLLGGLGEGQ